MLPVVDFRKLCMALNANVALMESFLSSYVVWKVSLMTARTQFLKFHPTFFFLIVCVCDFFFPKKSRLYSEDHESLNCCNVQGSVIKWSEVS